MLRRWPGPRFSFARIVRDSVRRTARHALPTPTAAIECLEDRTLLSGGSIWISADEIMQLSTSGDAWDELLGASQQDTGTPNLSDQNDDTDVYVLAKALVGVRLGDESLQNEARTAIVAAIGTEDGGRTLALGRNLASYVIAADLVGLDAAEDTEFRTWLSAVLDEDLDGRTLNNTHEDRANNWGTAAGGSRAAAAAYLGDQALLDRTAQVFEGWLGNRDVYAGFGFGSDLSWQADPDNPVGINPRGAMKDGVNVDGALPEEMRRGGSFQQPPLETGYPWGGLQGAVVQAEILQRAGYDAWQWEDRALLRAASYLYDELGWMPEGDDAWVPWLVNANYGADFATEADAGPGKIMAWTAWTHAEGEGSTQNHPPHVNAGADQSGVVDETIVLDGTVFDDGLPIDLGTPASAWSVVSGPGGATFTNAGSVDATVQFDAAGTYVLRLTADDGELSAWDDLVVDVLSPDAPMTAGYTSSADTMLSSRDADVNFGTDGEVDVDGAPDKSALLRWDLDLEAGSQVEQASITLNVTNPSRQAYELYQILRPWSEGTATWNQSTAGTTWDAAGAQGAGDRGATVLGQLLATSEGLTTIELNAAGIAVVQSWVDDPSSNYGLIVQDYHDARNGVDFDSRETSTAGRRPLLSVVYTRPDATPNEPPVADAGETYTGAEDAAVTLDASASTDPDGEPLTYTWDFGDGSPAVSTGDPVVQHEYAWGGTFDVQLTVSDPRGATSIDTTTVVVTEVNDVPVSDAGGPYSGTTGETFTFDADASSDFDNQDGTAANDQALTYRWDFGDGTTVETAQSSVEHTFTTAGNYTVTLVVNDGADDSAPVSTTAHVEAPNRPPFADAGGSYSGAEDTGILFDASASGDPDGEPLTYAWDFGDGSPAVSTGDPVVQHEYAWGGTFDVQLTVTDPRGATSIDTTTVAVTEVNDAPVADAGGPYSGTTGETFTFDAGASSDFDNQDGTAANDQMLTYRWDFGDGTTRETTEATVEHAYAADGNYSVTLVVSDGTADSAAVATSAAVETPPPVIPEQLYIDDISFESKFRGRGGLKHDIRIEVSVRRDSDKDGVAESSDALARGAAVTVALRRPDGSTLLLTGTTNSSGVFTSDWIREIDPGTYTANVTEVSLEDFPWDPAILLDQEDDSDGDGFPDEQHLYDTAWTELFRSFGWR